MTEKNTIKLSRPLTVHGKTGAETIHEITLKEPTGRLLFDHGQPFTSIVEQGQGDNTKQRIEIKMNPVAFRAYAVDMTGLDPSAVDALSHRDLRNIYNCMMRMLNDDGVPEGNSD